MNERGLQDLLADMCWLRTLARRLVHDPQVAEDVVQEACTIALRRAEPPQQWRAWLTGVVRKLLMNHRRRRLLQERHIAGRGDITGVDTAQTVQRAELQQRLAAAVMQLPEPFSTTVLLRFFDGLRPRQIAALQGVPVATVNSRLQRALKQLRARLDHDFAGRERWLSAFAPILWPNRCLSFSRGRSTRAVVRAPGLLLLPALALGLFAVALGVGAVSPEAAAVEVSPGRAPTALDVTPPIRTSAVAPLADPLPAAVSARARHVVMGRVVDDEGKPVAGVPVQAVAMVDGSVPIDADAVTDLAITGSDGSFSGELASPAAMLLVSAPGFDTLYVGEWSVVATSPAIVVAVRSIPLFGTVAAVTGRPLRGVRVAVELPHDLSARLGVRLDRTHSCQREASIAGDGSFSMPAVPLIAGAHLVVVADGCIARTMAIIGLAAPLHVVLEDADACVNTVRGRAVRADGSPAVDAFVALGLTSTRTADTGEFALDLRRAGGGAVLQVALAGIGHGRWDVPEAMRTVAAAWPRDLTLVLGPAPGSVRGRVVDSTGAPIAHAAVWIADPTPLGVEGAQPVMLEYLLGGAPIASAKFRMDPLAASVLDAPLASDGMTLRWLVDPEPSAGWQFVTTADDGTFVVPGLLARSYRLAAFDPRSRRFAGVEGVHANGVCSLVIDRTPVGPLLGRVVNRAGDPLPGVQVGELRVPLVMVTRVPGGRVKTVFVRETAKVTTAADGRFELPDFESVACMLRFEGDAVLPTVVVAETLRAQGGCIVVEPRCGCEVVLLDPEEADEVRGEDAMGAEARLVAGHKNCPEERDAIVLHAGRSGVFAVSERTARLVLWRAGRRGRVIPIAPDPRVCLRVH